VTLPHVVRTLDPNFYYSRQACFRSGGCVRNQFIDLMKILAPATTPLSCFAIPNFPTRKTRRTNTRALVRTARNDLEAMGSWDRRISAKND